MTGSAARSSGPRVGDHAAARWATFENELGELISRYSDILGPKTCSECGFAENCPHDQDHAVPFVDAMFQDYLLIHRWARLDGTGGLWDWTCSNGLLMIESIGLLQVVQDDARERIRR